MKLYFILFSTLLVQTLGFAQIGPKQIISNTVIHPRNVSTADIDGDGDLDVLSANQDDNSVTWFENIDGNGNFGAARIITNEVFFCEWEQATDIDGDGDLDVVVASNSGDLTWFENLDGQGVFGPSQLFNNNYNEATSVSSADLDNDGDMDIITTSYMTEEFKWFENIDGNGNFSDGILLNPNFEEIIFALPIDLDKDGNMDIVAISGGSEQLLWYKNIDGEGNFQKNILITDIPFGPWDMTIGDIDGDNDLDIALIALNDATIYWAKNIDGQGDFEKAQTLIPSQTLVGYSIELIDIDNDGDLDLFSVYGGPDFGTFSWFENTDGLGTFGTEQIIDSNISSPTFICSGDLNNDERQDVLVSIAGDNELVWYENILPLSINNKEDLNYNIYPIPTSGILKIEASEDVYSISIYTMTGKKKLENFFKKTIELSALDTGVYIIEVITINGKVKKQQIIIK